MLERAKRASHIDPPASSNAIMRRARPYRGENPEPGKNVTESLTPRPELENSQDPKRNLYQVGCGPNEGTVSSVGRRTSCARSTRKNAATTPIAAPNIT